LFMALIDEFPSLQKLIDEKVDKFAKKPHCRDKKTAGDIGEFLVLLFLSTNNTYESIKDVLIPEYSARQILWIQKKGIRAINVQNLGKIFQTNEVSWKLLIFNLEMAKVFINKENKANMDRFYGVPPKSVVNKVVDTIKSVKAINSFPAVIKAIGMTQIDSVDKMVEFMLEAERLSKKQKYTQ